MEPRTTPTHYILPCGPRTTDAGPALLVSFSRLDEAPMGYRELWRAFVDAYPGKWGVMSLPSEDRAMDGAHKYHVLVFDKPPRGYDLCDAPVRRGAA